MKKITFFFFLKPSLTLQSKYAQHVQKQNAMISNFSGHSKLQNDQSLILEKRRSLMQQICHSEKYHTKIGLSQIIHPFSCVSSSGIANGFQCFYSS